MAALVAKVCDHGATAIGVFATCLSDIWYSGIIILPRLGLASISFNVHRWDGIANGWTTIGIFSCMRVGVLSSSAVCARRNSVTACL